ncbi:MAG: dihydroorotase [Bacteroidota bacterium]
MKTYIIRQATIINEGKQFVADVLIRNERIEKIGTNIQIDFNAEEINAEGCYLMPGAIDDQVHFREPGLTHKAEIQTESRAAVAGGVTSFMEMPNTQPNTVTQGLLEEKYVRASQVSPANYSFFMGATNDNYDEVMRTDAATVCGVKIFMGSSTGNMLVDNPTTLDRIFADCGLLIATHCEDEATIKSNLEKYTALYGDNLNATHHPLIRDAEACYKSSSMAVALAKKHNTRLHILHISTAKEISLFSNDIPLEKKRITAEACIHHLWFSDEDYPEKGNWIKWNPAVKTANDRQAVWQAVLDNHIDVIATDHAPHTIEEKQQAYIKAPSGGPLVQHSVQAMFQFYAQGKISPETIVAKMCHHPAVLFRIKERGFIREGYFADLVLVKKQDYTVSKNNLLYKCQWSPFEGQKFDYTIDKTFVNGALVWQNGLVNDSVKGQRLKFNLF